MVTDQRHADGRWISDSQSGALVEPGGRVLLVDDSPMVRALVGSVLRRAGHEVDEAPDGAAALRLIESKPYDVILSDLRMPELDGLGLLESVKSQGTESEVIIITESHANDVEAAIRALRLGADDFLTRPLSAPDQIIVAVSRALDRKREREARKAEQERYRLLFERNLAGVYRTTIAGRFLDANDAYRRILGFAPDEDLRHRSARDVCGAAEYERVAARLKAEGMVSGIELRLRRVTGESIWVIANMALVPEEVSEERVVEGTLIDISERKRAEARLAAQLLITRVLAESASLAEALPIIVRTLCVRVEWDIGAVWLPDAADHRLCCAGVWQVPGPELAGFGAATRTISFERGLGLPGRVWASGAPAWIAEIAEDGDVERIPAATQCGLRTAVAFPISWKATTLGVVELFSREVRSLDEPLLAMTGDIGAQIGQFVQRKRAEEALARSERRLRTIFDAEPECVKLLAPDGTLLEMNAAGLAMIEADSLAQVVGHPVLPLVDEEDRPAFLGLMERAARGEPGTLQFKITGLKGSPRWLETYAVPLRDEKDQLTGVLGISRDITTHRRAAEALRKTEAQLRQAQKMDAVGRLAGGIAHDFNNLLSVIVGYCDLLTQDDNPPQTARRIDQMRKAAERAATLTRQLLAFGRRQVLQPQVICLGDVVSDIEPMLRRLISEDIQLITVKAEDSWLVHADPGQIEEVILNLALNARDAMPQGGRLLIEAGNAEVDESYAGSHPGARPGGHVMLSVSDTGHGMDAATLSQVFEPFFTTKGEGKGTGLGLAMVYGIVKQSEGYIEASSETGRGTTFRIYLPRTMLPAMPRRKASAMDEGRLRGRETVLVVEDEDVVRQAIREVLESGGYTVIEARSPEGALEIARARKGAVDCVLTDVVMPRMSGFQLAVELTAIWPSARIIYMSGYSEHAVRDRGPNDAGSAFLQKPITRENLLTKLREVLEDR